MAKKENPKPEERQQDANVSLVPMYSPLDVTKGLQAYRRGDVILYTIRGAPGKVQELIGELDNRGVKELVALVSHHTLDAPAEDVEETVVDVTPKQQDEEQ